MTKCEANKMWCDFDLDSETTHETNRQNRQVTACRRDGECCP